jgi:Protein of unknown function (DUF3551)
MKAAMKAALCLSGVLMATSAIGTPAHAQNRPWCAYYSAPFDATNCGFSTYEQCLATVSGVGGYCEPNTMYVPPPGADPASPSPHASVLIFSDA